MLTTALTVVDGPGRRSQQAFPKFMNATIKLKITSKTY